MTAKKLLFIQRVHDRGYALAANRVEVEVEVEVEILRRPRPGRDQAAWWPRAHWPMRSKEGGSAAPRPGHPLLAFDNVIVSPHCAGVTIESSMRMAEYSVRNVLDCFDGRLDPDVVVNRHLMREMGG